MSRSRPKNGAARCGAVLYTPLCIRQCIAMPGSDATPVAVGCPEIQGDKVIRRNISRFARAAHRRRAAAAKAHCNSDRVITCARAPHGGRHLAGAARRCTRVLCARCAAARKYNKAGDYRRLFRRAARLGGPMGLSGSVDFIFQRCVVTMEREEQ